jgi:hypothetical protein
MIVDLTIDPVRTNLRLDCRFSRPIAFPNIFDRAVTDVYWLGPAPSRRLTRRQLGNRQGPPSPRRQPQGGRRRGQHCHSLGD